jgi:Ca2+-binding EF-hand superfamily protein
MQISTAYSGASSFGLQALRDLFQPASASGAGQSLPTAEAASTTGERRTACAPTGFGGGGFNPATLSSLLSAQQSGPSPAASLLSLADEDGDGSLGVEELGTALGVDASELAEGFGQVDADGDGQVTEAELDAGMKAMFERNGPPRPPSEADMASSLLSIADADQSASLSLTEILSALGEEDDSEVSDAFASYDADGDEALNADELTSAIEAMISRMLSAYQSPSSDGRSVSVSA